MRTVGSLPAAAGGAAGLMLAPRLRLGRLPLPATRTARSQFIPIVAQQKKDPSSNPEYRRGSSNNYWRKRTPDRKSSRGQSLSTENEKRRRGRPAHMRSPDDTPLRDGNRDRLMGLLTDRATRALVHDCSEANPSLHTWLSLYMDKHHIPENGNWSDVSGENFLRTLLSSPVEEISNLFVGQERGAGFANSSPIDGDPRQIAQRIMDNRTSIALEWIEELGEVSELNGLLMQETLMSSFIKTAPAKDASKATSHPEVVDPEVDDSAAGCDD